MTKFEVGKRYFTRSICDHECIFSIKVLERSDKTIKVINEGSVDKKPCRLKLHDFDDCECVFPYGKYSMCPIIRAENELKEEQN